MTTTTPAAALEDATPAIVEALIGAAADAIRNQTPALTAAVGYVKSVTLELTLGGGHRVVDSTCWVERRGVHHPRKS